MVAEGEIPKSLYFKLFHMTCVVHLLHNCPSKFKMHFEDGNKLVFLIGWGAGQIQPRFGAIGNRIKSLPSIVPILNSGNYIIVFLKKTANFFYRFLC